MRRLESLAGQQVAVEPDVMIRNVGQEAVILDLKTERYLGLDEIGRRMWTVLVQSPSIEAAYAVLLDTYAVDAEQLADDLREFVNRLVEERLVTLKSASSAGGAVGK